jgi:RNA polymerase-binding transcription factor DksA
MVRAKKAAATKKSAAPRRAAKKAAKRAAPTGASKAAKKTASRASRKAPKRAATPRSSTQRSASTKRSAAVAPGKRPTTPAKKAPAGANASKRAAKARPVSGRGQPVPAKAVKPKAAKPAKSPFDSKFLDAQRQLLLDERATYTRQAATLQAEADALVADFEPGDVQFDEESGEGDTLAVERERDLALSAQARAAIAEIDQALARIDNNTYGVCEISGLAIPKERLRAIPWARERVEYKAAGMGRL